MQARRVISWERPQEIAEEVLQEYGEGPERLPEESVPQLFSIEERNGKTTVEYKWKKRSGEGILVEKIEFTDGNLRYLTKIKGKDGADSASFSLKGFSYILRKTSGRALKRLMSAATKLEGIVGSVVGYLKTAAGNLYLILRMEKSCWSFESPICTKHIRKTSWRAFGAEHRERVSELATLMLMKLHREDHVAEGIDASDLILDSQKAVLADPRLLKRAGSRSSKVENFIGLLRDLVKQGIGEGQAFYCLSLYASSFEDEVCSWYRKRRGRNPADLFAATKEIEKVVAS